MNPFNKKGDVNLMNQIYSGPMLLILLGVPFAVSADGHEQGKKKEKPPLECRIIVNEITTKGYPNEFALLEVELKNVSDKAIDIRYTCIPPILQYMKREDRTPDGKIFKGNCRDSLSPFSAEPRIFRLKPGQATKAHFGSVGAEGPGTYRIQAIFEYEKMKAISPVLEVEMKPLKKK